MTRRALDSATRLRAWWFTRQGFGASTKSATLDACVRQAGWIATAGSTGPYLSIRARMPGVSRETIDRAVMDGISVVEIPGAHARPAVVVPRDEMALALRLHLTTFVKHAASYFRRSGISEAAFNGVTTQVCRALDEGRSSRLAAVRRSSPAATRPLCSMARYDGRISARWADSIITRSYRVGNSSAYGSTIPARGAW